MQQFKTLAKVVTIFAVFFIFATSDTYSQIPKKPTVKPISSSPQSSTAACDTAIKQLKEEIEELRRQVQTLQTDKSSSIEMEAGLVFHSREVKPVVRETFYLLSGGCTGLISRFWLL